MANPNIVSVTSIYGESIGEALTTTVTTDIMTVASNKLLKINYIQVANDAASALTVVTVAIVKAGCTSDGIGSGEDNAATIYLCSTITLPADDVLVVVDKTSLPPVARSPRISITRFLTNELPCRPPSIPDLRYAILYTPFVIIIITTTRHL